MVIIVYRKSNSENYSLVDCNVTKIYPIYIEKRKVIKCFVVTYFLLH